MRNRTKRVHIGADVPALAVGSLGRRIRPPDRRPDADRFKGGHDAETSEANLVGIRRNKDVTWMKRAVPGPGSPRGINGVCHLREDRQRAIERRWREVAERDVQCLGRDVFHRHIRRRTFQSCLDDWYDGGVMQTRRRKSPERVGKARDLLGNDVEAERFDGDEPIVLRIVRAENRSQNAAADLVQDAIGAKGRRRSETGGLVERQRRLLDRSKRTVAHRSGSRAHPRTSKRNR